jgi:hypothetical protein
MARLTKSEILSLTPRQITQIEKTHPEQLRQMTRDLQAINRKSYQRLTAKGIRSQFVSGYESAGGTASLRGMDITDVRAEFETQLSLNKAQSRTVKGSQRVYSQMKNRIDPEGKFLPSDIKDLDPEQAKKFWNTYHKLSEKHAEISGNGSRGSPPLEVADIIFEELANSDFDPDDENAFDEFFAAVDEAYNKWYQESESEPDDYIEDPFDFGQN